MESKELYQANGWVWTDIIAQTEVEFKEITTKFAIHPMYQQDLMQEDHLPKFELPGQADIDGFIICRYLKELTVQGLMESSGRLAIVFNERRLITIHDGTTGIIDYVHGKYASKGKTPDLALVLCKLVKEPIKNLEKILYKLEDEIEYYENRITLRSKLPTVYDGLFKLKRKLSILKKFISLTRPIYFGLKEEYEDHPAVQDLGDMITRMETLTDEIIEKATNVINLNIALSAHRSNEVMKTLTIFSAFFLPLTFIVGVYGMNFKFMPELEHPLGYLVVWMVMLAICVVIFGWFRKKGWL
jgi:magnesium transporter